jgi:hypothetical protein
MLAVRGVHANSLVRRALRHMAPYGRAFRALSISAAVTFAAPLPKDPLTKFATAASSSSLCPRKRRHEGVFDQQRGVRASEQDRRQIGGVGSLTVRLPSKSA